MTTYYYHDTSQPPMNNKRQNIPKSIFTNNLLLNEEEQNVEMTNNNWFMSSPLLSPPVSNGKKNLNKLEHEFYSATTPTTTMNNNNPIVEQPSPISTMSTPNRRLSYNPPPTATTAAWHSLWTTSSITASPWQNGTITTSTTPTNDLIQFSSAAQQEEQATSPIDLDFLEDTPTSSYSFIGGGKETNFSREQRSQSVSAIFPSSITTTAAITASMVDDYFSSNKNKKNHRNHSISSSSSSNTAIGSHRTRRVSSSIWDFNPLSSSAFLPVSSFNSSNAHREQERRHSIATIATQQQRPITPPFTSTTITAAVAKVDENFNPLPSTCIDVSILGKGLPFHQLKQNQIIYHVQFKVKYRTDYFYYVPHLQEEEELNVGDRVIVEADRGFDVGKIIALIEQPLQQQKKKSFSNKATTDNNMNVVKRIFRRATEQELLSFDIKSQDEEKALLICQTKIKQRGLSMEVVEAEYQWDRRKLTFYFKANERIDFRELVRELFKIYKTRIWMCCASSSFATNDCGSDSVSSSSSSS